jgi:hypothetical protein
VAAATIEGGTMNYARAVSRSTRPVLRSTRQK